MHVKLIQDKIVVILYYMRDPVTTSFAINSKRCHNRKETDISQNNFKRNISIYKCFNKFIIKK